MLVREVVRPQGLIRIYVSQKVGNLICALQKIVDNLESTTSAYVGKCPQPSNINTVEK